VPQQHDRQAGKLVGRAVRAPVIHHDHRARDPKRRLNDATDKQVQLNEEVDGSVDDAVQSFKDLIDDNTR
jgi:hypothetical protein